MPSFSKLLSTAVIVALSYGSALGGPMSPQPFQMKPAVAASTQAPADTSAAAATTVVRNGTIVAVVTITLKSSVPTTQPIYCQLGSSVGYANWEWATIKATRSGNTASCTVSIPYSWTLPSAALPVDTSLQVMTGQYETSTPTPMARHHISDLPSLTSVPANGTTTTFKAAVTL